MLRLLAAAGVGALGTWLTLRQRQKLRSPGSQQRRSEVADEKLSESEEVQATDTHKDDEQWREKTAALDAKLASASRRQDDDDSDSGSERETNDEISTELSQEDLKSALYKRPRVPKTQRERPDDPIAGAQDIYRSFMGLNDGGDVARANAVEIRKLRRRIQDLLAKNAELSAKLAAHGDTIPRAHVSTEFTASATGVRFLKPLNGEWVVVEGGDSFVDVVADEYEPSHIEAQVAGCTAEEPRYKAFRVVVTDTHTNQVQLNEYLSATAPYRSVHGHFHAFTTTHGFDFGLEFSTEEDSSRIFRAVTAARTHLMEQAAPQHIPCLVQSWQDTRAEISKITPPPESDTAAELTNQPLLLSDVETQQDATASLSEISKDATGLPQFTREVENHYFDYYAAMSNQQLMLEDSVRTLAYLSAIEANAADFQGKVVVDVGAGSGVLSFFAARAGAARVYAIEASSIAECARALVNANGMQHVIKVIHATVEATTLPEQCDVIISEPMGFMLFHEQMLDSFVVARDKFLKKDGLVFPSTGTLYAAPVSDAEMYAEQALRAEFWSRPEGMYGIDVSAMRALAARSHFASSIVDIVRPSMLPCGLTAAAHMTVDFRTATPADFDKIRLDIPPAPVGWHEWDTAQGRGIAVHGIACWFDVAFEGSDPENSSKLSTAPDCDKTHWYQTILPLNHVLEVPLGHEVGGSISLVRNRRRSYDITVELSRSARNTIEPDDPTPVRLHAPQIPFEIVQEVLILPGL